MLFITELDCSFSRLYDTIASDVETAVFWTVYYFVNFLVLIKFQGGSKILDWARHADILAWALGHVGFVLEWW